MRKANSSSGTWAEVHGALGDVTKGEPGKSAYEIAVEHGFEGTEEEWLAYVQANADRAVSASTAAQEAKAAAQYASDEAQGHAESASTSAGVAHTEAEAAAESAARAEAAATSAGESRDGAAMSAVDAADSATAAAASATAAASQALLATGRADEARQSQIDAHDSEVHCEEMWLAFQRSPDLAKQYAEAAALSAQNAADSETAAEGYKEDVEDLKLEIVGYRNETSTLCTQTGVYASQADASAQAAAASAAEAGASAELVTERIAQEVDNALESHLAGKLDVDGKAVDSAHADNADTVNNHTVLSDVPANAVFTDTTYQQMTSSELEDGISTQGRVVAAHTIATFILNVIADVINSAPAALDTLEELAAAINDDPDFHVTVMNAIGQKLDKAGGVVTGDLTVNGTFTADVTGNADTATKATGDKNGKDIATTYLPLSGGTMTGSITVKRTNITRGTSTTATYPFSFRLVDNVNNNLGGLYYEYFADKSAKSHLVCYPGTTSADTWSSIGVGYNNTGSPFTWAPTPANADNSTKIATTAWVRTATGNTNLNAATATKATGDKNGNDIAATYLPLAGGTITGSLDIKGELNVGGSGSEGGEIHLNASTDRPAENGIVVDQYVNELRIFGIPSSDGTTKKGTGTPLRINPYAKTITGGYTFTGNVTGNVSGSSGSCTGNSATATKINGKTIPVVSSFNSTTGVLALTSLS